MYNAKVLPVMIASPNDVQEERNAIREIVNSWNYTESFHKGLVVLPVGWETHSSPELGIAPQDQINDRLVDRCDILVGVFWTKIGSPTQSEKSGTVEEIKRHVDAGKPAMLYFCQKPVAPESLDVKQWKAREEFRKWCEPQGLYEPFSSLEILKEKFSRQFRICISENSYVQSQIGHLTVVSEQIENGLTSVKISKEALQLLEGAHDGNGMVTVRNYLGGSLISGGEVSISTKGSGKDDARWRAAVSELDDFGVIEERSFGSGIYFVTDSGYEAIERHRQQAE